MSRKAEPAPAAFDLASVRRVDMVELVIKHPVTGAATDWIWRIAGPSHSKTVEYAESIQRRRLDEERSKEQARVNGKKWKATEKDPDEIRLENVKGIAARVIDFSPVQMNGTSIDYAPDVALKLLADPAYDWLLGQVIELITDDQAFFPVSAKI